MGQYIGNDPVHLFQSITNSYKYKITIHEINPIYFRCNSVRESLKNTSELQQLFF